MIVLHPNSVCDVCLDGYGDSNPPHSIVCGHSFCLRCLMQLSRQACPLCRKSFVDEDIRKLHVDWSNKQDGAVCVDTVPSKFVPDVEVLPTTAKTLRSRITRIVLDGGKATDVRDLIDEVRTWLSRQPFDEHADLRSAYLLLFKYTDLQFKVKEQKAIIEELNQLCDELKDKMLAEREMADVKYQELSQKRMEDMETAMAVERNLRDRFDEMDREWRFKYDQSLEDCRRLRDELVRTKHNPLPTPPRSLEASFLYSAEHDLPVAEPMDDDVVVHERPKSSGRANNDRFQLSPIPATATLPVSNLPNRQNFRPLTAEESDIEDLKFKRQNPHLLRSIDPIPIRPGIHRMNSSSSMVSRSGLDSISGRSIPRSSVDVHMASCSSSPTTAIQCPSRERDRLDEPMAVSVGKSQEVIRSRARGATFSSFSREQEEQQERARKLSDVLDRHRAPSTDMPPPSLKGRQEPLSSPDSSAPATRTTSPTSPPAAIQSPLLQRPPYETGSRASTAALEAERARAVSHKDPSIRTSPTSPTAAKDRDRDAPVYQYPQYSPQRSTVGSIRRKPIPSAQTQTQASGITRSLWGLEQAQRV